MRFFKYLVFKYLVLCFLLVLPISLMAGPPPAALQQSDIEMMTGQDDDEDGFAYYDLRDRKSYVQITNEDNDPNPLCIHVQIFQQDQGCSELDFNDQLTPNDTVIYDLDNLVRNNGTAVPINLDDNSYGYVAISAYNCSDVTESVGNDLIGNFRIIDDAGYEYRMNLINNEDDIGITAEFPNPESPGISDISDTYEGNIIIPFNTIAGAKYSDIIMFVAEVDRDISGNDGVEGGFPPQAPPGDGSRNDTVYNEDVGVTFDVFLLDENEERLSCDQKTIGCGPSINMNYGINEDYPNSKGGPLLCEGGGLLPGQTHGYVLLERGRLLSPIDAKTPPEDESFELGCLVGINNGNGTGSMDTCQAKCNFDDDPDYESDCEVIFDPF